MGIVDIIAFRQVVAVLDTFFGDSGKGKIVDFLASLTDKNKLVFPVVYRPNGGPNTGHTVRVRDKKYVFHLIPSAAVNPEVKCLIGRGVVFDPPTFFAELDTIKEHSWGNIEVDRNAHVIMPWHIMLDNLREAVSGENKIGTTGKGVGPCMETKCARNGFVTIEMLNNNTDLETAAEKAIERIGG